jgi:hypothetical protein
MLCQVCGGNKDVADFSRGDQRIVLCVDCRFKLLAPRNKGGRQPGRPSLGVTKKVSLTLPEDYWEWIDEKASGNRSELLRYLISRQRNDNGEWSNAAAVGYMISAMRKLGYEDEAILIIESAMHHEFDTITVEEAQDIYNRFS